MQPGISQGQVLGVAEQVAPQCCPSLYRLQLAHHLDAAAAQQMSPVEEGDGTNTSDV